MMATASFTPNLATRTEITLMIGVIVASFLLLIALMATVTVICLLARRLNQRKQQLSIVTTELAERLNNNHNYELINNYIFEFMYIHI